MYKSQEIRWFIKEANDPISRWFSDRGKVFSKTGPRGDFYLSLPRKEDINIKLREGNVEIKERHGEPLLHHLTKNAVGYLEDWVKWSFNVEDNDELSTAIIKDKRYSWIEVYKERIGIKLTPKPDGTIDILDIKDRIPFGCQIEYSRLIIKGEEWFTLGLEWFGDQYIDLDPLLLEQLLGNTKLRSDDSFGYNTFLNCKIQI